MASKSEVRERESRSFGVMAERGAAEGWSEPGYNAARAHQLALRGGEPGYGYGEDYKRDRRRHAEDPAVDQPSPDAII